MFSIIAAIGKNRELGKDGKLLFRLPGDLKFFRETTMGHKVLMGRKTWESLPGKLRERENIVVTRNPNEVLLGPRPERPSSRGSGAFARRDSANPEKDLIPDFFISDLPGFIRENEGSEEEIFVIGGGMLYWETIKHCQRLYLTEVEAEAEADTFFPEFNKDEWARTVIKKGEDNGLKYSHVRYERKK